MRLLPRRGVPADATAPVITDAVPTAASSKGRPTPKRRDAGPKRGPVAPAPKTRREALARQRAQAKTRSSTPTSGLTAADRRARMAAGDPAFLPRRDAGPVRALARDYVDSRRMLSNVLMLIIPLLFLSYLLPYAALIVYILLAVVIVEWMTSARRVLTLAADRGIDPSGERTTSLGLYIGTRAYLPRRWRMPRPRVESGAEI